MSIERRIEIPADHRHPDYENVEFTEERVARGAHRGFVGGLWEEMGQMQLDFVRQQGLEPGHRFLDVGCGSLRAGRLLVDYLDPGHYYGTDINHELIEAGYATELTDEQRVRLPEANLRSTDRFDNDFGVQFDMAIAQSVFTHVPLNHMRLCLYRVAKVMRPGGRFYVTFFENGRDFPLDQAPKERQSMDRAELVLVLPSGHALGRQAVAVGGPLHRQVGPPAGPADDGVHPAGG